MEKGNAMGKLMAGTAAMGIETKRAVNNVRQDGKIEDQRKQIARLTTEIGQLTVRGIDRGQDMGEAVMERYGKIVAAREAIREMDRAKLRTYVTCPHCGEKVLAGMTYCGSCGERIAEE